MKLRIIWPALLGAFLFALTQALPASAGNRWGADYFPNVEVTDQNGRTLRFYDDLIRGRIVVISFIFTSCKDLCPLNTARLAQVAETLGDRVGKDIFFVSLTVDPDNDTPERLKAFGEAFYSGPGWSFVTGDPAKLREISAKLGNKSEVPSDHRNEIVLGNDKTGEWARNTPFGEIESLAMAIRDMDPEWRSRENIPEARYLTAEEYSHLQITAEPGQALFQKLCSACHTVGVGDRTGPDLLGVTERREHPWLADFIRDPEQLRRAGDPEALALMERFTGARMPTFGLSELDAEDLIAFLRNRSATVMQARQEAVAHGTNHHHGAENQGPEHRGPETADHSHGEAHQHH